MIIDGIFTYTNMSGTVFGYGNTKHSYNNSVPNGNLRGDSVSISAGAIQKYQESVQIPDDIRARARLTDSENIRIGLFGVSDFSSVDAIYIPKRIQDSMLSLDEHRRAYGVLSESNEAIARDPGVLDNILKKEENIKDLWATYKKILADYSIDYEDSAAITDLLNNQELRDTIERDFESRT